MHQKFTYPLIILEHHLDTFGHVNNAVYLEIYEQARWELITQNGYGLPVVQELKQGPIILEIKVRFLKELKLRDRVTIETQCTELKKAASTISQRSLKEKGELCSDADFKFALFDTVKRKIIAPTPRWLKAIGADPNT
jgi:YbgC/YbaW family acyl-CoA thioester hydrolase